jgi:cytochrome c oxidase assembly factor 6
MGFFSSDSDQVKPEDMTKKSSRQACWDSRDVFFACLDKHDIIDPIKDERLANQKCGKENSKFEKDCIQSWVCEVIC